MMKDIIFGVSTPKKDSMTEDFMSATKKRLKSADPAKNPFSEAKVSKKVYATHYEYLFKLRPLYPEIYVFFWVPLILLAFPVWGWLKIVALGASALMSLTALFWSAKLSYAVLHKGGLKAGCDTSKWAYIDRKRIGEVV